MKDPQGQWRPVERLDPEWAVAALRAAEGVALEVLGRPRGGQVGAAFVAWRDGHRSVLTWQPGQRLRDYRARQLTTMDVLRGRGCPAPVVELAAEVRTPVGEPAVVLVQQLLPGAPTERLTMMVLEQALAINDLQSGALVARADVPAVRLYLAQDGPGYCLHEPLRHHCVRTRALERWVVDVAAELPTDTLGGHDAVHMDFQPDNILVRAGRISGVVDWDGAGRGDRRLDLVTLRFGLWPAGADRAVVRRLDERIDAMPPEVLRPAWAHMSLRIVDWAIRHYARDDVDRWLDLAETRID